MTITYYAENGEVLIVHGERSRRMHEHSFTVVANTEAWGDVQAQLDAAKRQPGVPITVDNTARLPRPRNARANEFAISQ